MNKIKEFVNRTNILRAISIIFYIFRIFKIKKNKIVCINFKGKGYGDNPKYIVDQLIENNDDVDVVWFVNNTNIEGFPSKVRLVKMYSLKYFYEMTTAKIWISNVRMPSFVRKRKKQYYIQTWHGGLGVKKIEAEAQSDLTYYYIQCAKNDSKMMDLAISNSNYRTNIYKNFFWYNGEVLECGCPRNDIFFNQDLHLSISSKIKKMYNIDEGRKIILYAPTFRIYEFDYMNIDFKKIKDNLLNNANEDYVFLLRLHPKLKINIPKSEYYINVSDYPDMDELLISSDILITDYSSLMFDYIYMNKPIYLYAPDYEKYMDSRGFSFKYSELPFPISYKKEELSKSINNKEYEEYNQRLSEFKKEMDLKDDGTASETIRNKIKLIIFGGNNEKI